MNCDDDHGDVMNSFSQHRTMPLVMHLIIVVLLVFFLHNCSFQFIQGPDMLWSFKYVPLGLEVAAIWCYRTATTTFQQLKKSAEEPQHVIILNVHFIYLSL